MTLHNMDGPCQNQLKALGEKTKIDQLIQEDKDDVIPYCIAIGEVKKLVNFFMSRGQLKEALLVAQVQLHHCTRCSCWWVGNEEARRLC